jgi:hypothetical protein
MARPPEGGGSAPGRPDLPRDIELPRDIAFDDERLENAVARHAFPPDGRKADAVPR